MKRELKLEIELTCHRRFVLPIAEPIPMKRELKQQVQDLVGVPVSEIAEPIPMKRELKLRSYSTLYHLFRTYCRAYPDEKGIETQKNGTTWREAIPPYCRAYPDEKGIETTRTCSRSKTNCKFIAEPIPMKRELKHSN